MFSFSIVSAQTLDQYKDKTVEPPTMNQLVDSSSLRAKISMSDLKLVSTYCETQLSNNKTSYDATYNKFTPEFIATHTQEELNTFPVLYAAKSKIDYLTPHCAEIQAEINNRPVVPVTPVPAGVTLTKITKDTSSTSFVGPSTIITNEPESTSGLLQVVHSCDYDSYLSLRFQRNILAILLAAEWIAASGLAIVLFRYRR